jgi:hypothetical protein
MQGGDSYQAPGSVSANPSPTTSGGLTTVYHAYSIHIANLSNSWVCVELFNVSSSPTLGTTTPFDHFTIPTGAAMVFPLGIPDTLGTGIYIAGVTAYNGSTAPNTGVDVAIRYN